MESFESHEYVSQYHCKGCKSFYMKEYYQRNKERIKEYTQRNKERIKEYRQQNRERISTHAKEYRQQNRERLSIYNKEYRQQNKERILTRNKKYFQQNGKGNSILNTMRKEGVPKENLSLPEQMFETIVKLWKEQNRGKCAICGKQLRWISKNKNDVFTIDHLHGTSIIRGLLCNNCNTGIGMFQDNSEVLQKAINYLKDFESHG